MKLVVGTRSSKLAIAQTNIFLNGYKNICNWYAEEDQKFIDVDFEIKKFVTQGDKYSKEGKVRFDKINFVSDIEKALLAKEIDIAVHSTKDMPAKLDPRFEVLYLAEDEYKDDKLILNSNQDLYIFRDEIDVGKISKNGELENLSGLRVGTSSLRRKMQAKLFYGADNVLDIRGNVDTRIQKLSDNQFDCIILAEQGLRRLGIYKSDLNCLVSSKLPAMGQGLICLQCRADDSETKKFLWEVLGLYNCMDTPNKPDLDIEMSLAQDFVSALGADCNSAIAIKVDLDNKYDLDEINGINLQAEIYGKDSFIRVASHDENGHILKKYETDERLTGAWEGILITDVLIEEAIEKGALDLLNEHN